MDSGTDYSQAHPPAPFLRKVRDYLWRATWWRCPVCGLKPIFPSLSRTRTFNDWFTPLDGCPHCGYAYDREPGYFLWAVWALGYIVSAVVGTLLYVYLQIWHGDLSILATILLVMLPLPFINVLFARHAKAYFLAADHLADPHLGPEDGENDGDGGGPGLRTGPAPLDAPVLAAPGGGSEGDGPRERPEPEREPAGSAR